MPKNDADPFGRVRDATLKHRAKHGCGAWPYDNGPLLGTLAAAMDARRVLELGCALGYTSLSFAHGAPKAKVDTIERDPEHVRLAREHIEAAGFDSLRSSRAMTWPSSTAIRRFQRCTRPCTACSKPAAC
jgi:predicted O-methyltransferase YrrM